MSHMHTLLDLQYGSKSLVNLGDLLVGLSRAKISAMGQYGRVAMIFFKTFSVNITQHNSIYNFHASNLFFEEIIFLNFYQCRPLSERAGIAVRSMVYGSESRRSAVCEFPCLFCGNSHSNAAFTFRPAVRVHRLPRCSGEALAALIVRVVCGRGLGINLPRYSSVRLKRAEFDVQTCPDEKC